MAPRSAASRAITAARSADESADAAIREAAATSSSRRPAASSCQACTANIGIVRTAGLASSEQLMRLIDRPLRRARSAGPSHTRIVVGGPCAMRSRVSRMARMGEGCVSSCQCKRRNPAWSDDVGPRCSIRRRSHAGGQSTGQPDRPLGQPAHRPRCACNNGVTLASAMARRP